MKIYTRRGDDGQTCLPDGTRVPKDAPVLEACGTIDELNSALGLVRAEPLDEQLDRLLEQVQHELFQVGAGVAQYDPPGNATGRIGPQHVQAIEEAIDRFDQELEPLSGFILPSGTRAAAGLHLARTVCRRAERRLLTLSRNSEHEIPPSLTAYLNRLGDLLFVLARATNARAGHADMPWRNDI